MKIREYIDLKIKEKINEQLNEDSYDKKREKIQNMSASEFDKFARDQYSKIRKKVKHIEDLNDFKYDEWYHELAARYGRKIFESLNEGKNDTIAIKSGRELASLNSALHAYIEKVRKLSDSKDVSKYLGKNIGKMLDKIIMNSEDKKILIQGLIDQLSHKYNKQENIEEEKKDEDINNKTHIVSDVNSFYRGGQ